LGEGESFFYLSDTENEVDFMRIKRRIQLGVDFIRRFAGGRTLLYKVRCPETLANLIFLLGININAQNEKEDTTLFFRTDCFVNRINDNFRKTIDKLFGSDSNPD
jgi:hypothetical protein